MEPSPTRWPRGLSPLAYRRYALFWGGLVTARTGRSIEEVGAIWLVFVLTDSPVLLGVLGLARAVPAIVLGPFAGVVVDRIDQRRLLVVTQTLRMLGSLALGLLVVTGRAEVWHVYLQVAIQTAIETFDGTARQALFPRLVPTQRLPEAVTLTSTAARLSTLVGPVLGGMLIATLGIASPFLVNAASFVGLAGAALAIGPLPAIATGVRESFRGDVADGIRHILRSPVLSGLLRLEVVFGVLQENAVLITIIGTQTLGVGPEGLGGLLSAPALGALAGVAVLLTFGQGERQGRLAIVLMLLYAATLVVLAFSGVYVVSLAALALLGFVDSITTVTRHSLMQLATPAHLRGRVMANMGTITRSTTPLSEAQSGFLSGVVGAPGAVVAAAAALAVAALLTARTNPTLWRFRRDDVLEPAAASVASVSVPRPPPATPP